MSKAACFPDNLSLQGVGLPPGFPTLNIKWCNVLHKLPIVHPNEYVNGYKTLNWQIGNLAFATLPGIVAPVEVYQLAFRILVCWVDLKE